MRGYNLAVYEMAQDLNLFPKFENYQSYTTIETVTRRVRYLASKIST